MGAAPHSAWMRRQHQIHFSIDLGTSSQSLDGIELKLVAVVFADDSHAQLALRCRLFRRFLRRVVCREREFYFAVGINVDCDLAATD